MLKSINNIESIIYIAYLLCIVSIFSTNYFPKYDMSALAGILFVIYWMKCGLLTSGSKFSKAMMILGFMITLSSLRTNSTYYGTSYFKLLTYSLSGISTFFITRSYIARDESRFIILKYFSYLFAVLGALTFIYCYKYTAVAVDINDITALANIFYNIVMPLPLLFLFVKGSKRDLIYLIAFFCVIITLKRSGAIIMLIALIPMFLSMYKRYKHKYSIPFILVCITLLLTIYYYKDRFMLNESISLLMERFDNMSSDHGSGRVVILDLFYNDIPKYGVRDLLIGHGYGSFAPAYGYASAHNDYADIFYSYGIIGFISFMVIVISIIHSLRLFKLNDNSMPFWLFFIIFFVINVTGGIFCFYNFSLPLFVFMAIYDLEKINIKLKKKSITSQL